ncbi:MAG: sphinganine-phosphate aldolase [Acidimicrobiaceae bacterium]|jgi:glutamate/tyrosine decarboxylase-like PLP-dependent enzyme
MRPPLVWRAVGKLPAKGRDADSVLAEVESFKLDDKDFRNGRVFGLVFHADEALEEVAAAAHNAYLWHNALNPNVFPSLRHMTNDVVEISAALLGGEHIDDALAGFLTSGGTESILMAVKAAKMRAVDEREVHDPNIVLPMSAHAAFDKACQYFGVESRRVPVRDDFRADVDAVAASVDDSTVLVVGSAPQYPQGVIDPIPELASLAAERGIGCHVDACMGGFVLPFLERSGHDLPPWDFRVPGVTSLSADLHKYGYVPKGISVIMHRSKELRRYQTFAFDGWLGGFYGSSGILGTKPGGPIAAAWAALQFLGEEGYCRLSEEAFTARERFVAGVRATPGLAIVGEPEVTLAAITASGVAPHVDVFALGDELFRRGWHLDRQGPPDSLHATCMPVHLPVIDEFLADLRDAVAAVTGTSADDRSTNYAVLE